MRTLIKNKKKKDNHTFFDALILSSKDFVCYFFFLLIWIANGGPSSISHSLYCSQFQHCSWRLAWKRTSAPVHHLHMMTVKNRNIKGINWGQNWSNVIFYLLEHVQTPCCLHLWLHRFLWFHRSWRETQGN